MSTQDRYPDLNRAELFMSEANERERETIRRMNELARKQQEAQAAAFEAWAEKHIAKMVRGEMQRVRNLDLADRIKEWASEDDEHLRLTRVFECARQLLQVYDVQPGPGGFSRKSEPQQSPAAVDWWGELWCAVQAAGSVPASPDHAEVTRLRAEVERLRGIIRQAHVDLGATAGVTDVECSCDICAAARLIDLRGGA